MEDRPPSLPSPSSGRPPWSLALPALAPSIYHSHIKMQGGQTPVFVMSKQLLMRLLRPSPEPARHHAGTAIREESPNLKHHRRKSGS